jgi:hypothetical protein
LIMVYSCQEVRVLEDPSGGSEAMAPDSQVQCQNCHRPSGSNLDSQGLWPFWKPRKDLRASGITLPKTVHWQERLACLWCAARCGIGGSPGFLSRLTGQHGSW